MQCASRKLWTLHLVELGAGDSRNSPAMFPPWATGCTEASSIYSLEWSAWICGYKQADIPLTVELTRSSRPAGKGRGCGKFGPTVYVLYGK